MAPAGATVEVRFQHMGFTLAVLHSEFIEAGEANIIEIRTHDEGAPYLYYESVNFLTSDATRGLGAVAFYRAAQAAMRAGFVRIELLAAGGRSYKGREWRADKEYVGYHAWARYGFNAKLHPVTLQLISEHPKLRSCRELLDIIDIEPAWWKRHGDGCFMTFDLRRGSRSWRTLKNYLKERRLTC